MADEETLMSRNEVIGFFRRMSTTDVSGSTHFNVMSDIDIKSIIKEGMKDCDYWKFVASPTTNGVSIFLKWENYE